MLTCPDCGRRLTLTDAGGLQGEGGFYILEKHYGCIHCQKENEMFKNDIVYEEDDVDE